MQFDMAIYDAKKHIIKTPDGREVLASVMFTRNLYSGVVEWHNLDTEVHFDESGVTSQGVQLVMGERPPALEPFDASVAMNRKCVTQDGRPARVVCTDRECEYPVMVLVKAPAGEDLLCTKMDGEESATGNHLGLRMIPEGPKETEI